MDIPLGDSRLQVIVAATIYIYLFNNEVSKMVLWVDLSYRGVAGVPTIVLTGHDADSD